MVRIKEGERSEELRELLWYKKSENGGELLQIQALGPYNEPRGIAIANQDKNEFLLALLNEQKAYVRTRYPMGFCEKFSVWIYVCQMC